MTIAATIASLCLMLTPPLSDSDSLLTVAERSGYTATATSAEVEDLVKRIAAQSSIAQVLELGRTVEGKAIPLVLVANPPVASIAEARAASRDRKAPLCFIFANIHAGEVEGKEACLMLLRELALDPSHPLLKDLIVIIAPNYNADGNDRFDDVAKNRPGQDGPAQCGVRPNAQGFDLNRDYVKLEAPETRALVKFLTECDPHITVDCHTTNGSHHRYVLTYDAPLNPSGQREPMDFIRFELLPEVTRRMKTSTGYDLWFYGNFNSENPPTAWETYSSQARYGASYQGLRNQMSILSEAYSYAPYKDRIIATREFLRDILKFVAEQKSRVLDIHEKARNDTIQLGLQPAADDFVGIRHRMAAYPDPVVVKGYRNATGGSGGAVAHLSGELGPHHDYTVTHMGRFEPTLSVRRPFAYIIPPLESMNAIVEKLQQHGIEVEPVEGFATVEEYKITAIERAEREFQKHREVKVEVEVIQEQYRIRTGSRLVRTAQPLGTLAVYLLEPQSEDGLVTWNFFDAHLEVGKRFPVLRVVQPDQLEIQPAP